MDMLFESRVASGPKMAVIPAPQKDQAELVQRSELTHRTIQRDSNQIASNLISALTQAGLFHRGQDGQVREVSLRSVQVFQYQERAWAAFEVDMQRLPLHITADDLISPRIVHHLSSACGRKISIANSTGITYITQVLGQAAPKPAPVRLPTLAPFTLEGRPESPHVIPVGVTRRGPLWTSVNGVGHALVAGTTRSGKSSFMHAALAGLCLGSAAEQTKVAIIDPKGNEFVAWGDAPHLLAPIATSAAQAGRLLSDLAEEMDERGRLFAGKLARTLDGYNKLCAQSGQRGLPLIVVFIDEFVDLILQAGLNSDLKRDLSRLASKGSGLGITLMLGTTSPRADVMDTIVRGNCTLRVAFRVPEASQSRLILGEGGAEKIDPGTRGRLLAHTPEGSVEAQGYYLDDAALRRIALGFAKAAPHGAVSLVDEASAELQFELTEYALENLGGAFTINRLFEGLGKRHPKHVINSLARRMERQGLLSAPRDITSPRRVTATLEAWYLERAQNRNGGRA